jgi:hypothetical protein
MIQTKSDTLLRLQRKYGNRFVQRIVDFSQRETVGADVVSEVEQSILGAKGDGQALDSGIQARRIDFQAEAVQQAPQSSLLNQFGISRGAPSIIRRYSHEDCTDADLRHHIWPADRIAKRMVDRAIAALSTSPLAPPVSRLMLLNFNDASASSVAEVLAKFREIKREYDGNSYQYECEDDCDSENAYVYAFWTDVHLCMNKLRGRSNDFIAGVMVHEMSHYAAGTDDNEYFYPGTGQTSLSPSDAVDNADSYEGFVGRL